MTGSLDFVDSISTVTLDVESGQFYASYDSSRDSPSLAVVAVVATALGKDPQALTPLHSTIDTDALDTLTTKSAAGQADCLSISFCYEGLEVTVSSEGVIESAPTENT
jgi:hypothetical protein